MTKQQKCSICRKPGHNKSKCPTTTKPAKSWPTERRVIDMSTRRRSAAKAVASDSNTVFKHTEFERRNATRLNREGEVTLTKRQRLALEAESQLQELEQQLIRIHEFITPNGSIRRARIEPEMVEKIVESAFYEVHFFEEFKKAADAAGHSKDCGKKWTELMSLCWEQMRRHQNRKKRLCPKGTPQSGFFWSTTINELVEPARLTMKLSKKLGAFDVLKQIPAEAQLDFFGNWLEVMEEEAKRREVESNEEVDESATLKTVPKNRNHFVNEQRVEGDSSSTDALEHTDHDAHEKLHQYQEATADYGMLS